MHPCHAVLLGICFPFASSASVTFSSRSRTSASSHTTCNRLSRAFPSPLPTGSAWAHHQRLRIYCYGIYAYASTATPSTAS